jgi:hypothetical protein
MLKEQKGKEKKIYYKSKKQISDNSNLDLCMERFHHHIISISSSNLFCLQPKVVRSLLIARNDINMARDILQVPNPSSGA